MFALFVFILFLCSTTVTINLPILLFSSLVSTLSFSLFLSPLGTHLVREVAYMLMKGKIEYIPKEQLDLPICFTEEDCLSHLPSPSVLHSHAPLRMLPDELTDTRGQVLAVVRDPRDVCVSFWLFVQKFISTNIPFDIFLEKFINGKGTVCGLYALKVHKGAFVLANMFTIGMKV